MRSIKDKSINNNKNPTRFTMNFYQKSPRAAMTTDVAIDNTYEEIPHASKKVVEQDYDHLNFNRASQNNDNYFKEFVMRKFND